MNILKAITFTYCACTIALLFGSCAKDFTSDNYTAYFGGEVTNRSAPFVLLFKDEVLIDSIAIDKNNRFFIKFDSLAPGMYTFRHEPEYQYVYFEKNDSLMVTINPRDFDESIVFSGRGDQKNNFLMEMFLRNEKDRDHMFTIYDYDVPEFTRATDSIYAKNLRFYDKSKAELQWDDEFDVFAKAAVDFPYYTKKEIYPIVHQIRTGKDVVEKLPKNFYYFRKDIDYDNAVLSNYAPFVKYLSVMLNNLATIKYHNHFTQQDIALKTNTNKLEIADTLIKNENTKNTILNNIAFTYLLEDQNVANNQKFLQTYRKYSTDKSQKNEILKIGTAIQLLKDGKTLPTIQLADANGNEIASSEISSQKAVIFFWSENATSHLVEAHKKALALKKRFPEYEFIAVNIDPDQEKWTKLLEQYKTDGVLQFRAVNFEDLRTKWAITKIHRTIVLGEDGNIRNAFTNLFDSDFEQNLLAPPQHKEVAKQ